MEWHRSTRARARAPNVSVSGGVRSERGWEDGGCGEWTDCRRTRGSGCPLEASRSLRVQGVSESCCQTSTTRAIHRTRLKRFQLNAIDFFHTHLSPRKMQLTYEIYYEFRIACSNEIARRFVIYILISLGSSGIARRTINWIFSSSRILRGQSDQGSKIDRFFLVNQ